jgi:uncharacterized protein (TIGR02265 family)
VFRIPRIESCWKADGSLRVFTVYILSNHSMTLYTGVTNDLARRVWEHKHGLCEFTSRYHFDRVVYFETYETAAQAIAREKQIKSWTRTKKIALIKSMNPTWSDLTAGPAYPSDMTKVKGGALQSRLAFVREHRGDEGVQRVLARLSDADRATFSQVLVGGWYPFDLNERLDEAVAAEMGMGDKVFLMMGEKSAMQNLTGAHRALLTEGDPHGLLRRTPQIYQMYYDTGRRTYENLGEKKARIRTYDAPTFSRHDCLTVVGWHTKAVEMCGGKNPRVTETLCRARGAEVCEYLLEWS